jgi:hypothetical protein
MACALRTNCAVAPLPSQGRGWGRGSPRLPKCARTRYTSRAWRSDSGRAHGAYTSLGEASARTQATDRHRRETPTIRTGSAGIRRSPKWLRSGEHALAPLPSTPRSAKARPEGVAAGSRRREHTGFAGRECPRIAAWVDRAAERPPVGGRFFVGPRPGERPARDEEEGFYGRWPEYVSPRPGAAHTWDSDRHLVRTTGATRLPSHYG